MSHTACSVGRKRLALERRDINCHHGRCAAPHVIDPNAASASATDPGAAAAAVDCNAGALAAARQRC